MFALNRREGRLEEEEDAKQTFYICIFLFLSWIHKQSGQDCFICRLCFSTRQLFILSIFRHRGILKMFEVTQQDLELPIEMENGENLKSFLFVRILENFFFWKRLRVYFNRSIQVVERSIELKVILSLQIKLISTYSALSVLFYWHSPPPTLEALLFCLFREEGILFVSSMISLKLSSFFFFSISETFHPKVWSRKFEICLWWRWVCKIFTKQNWDFDFVN